MTSTGNACKRPGLSGVSFSGFVLIEEWSVLYDCSRNIFFWNLFWLFTFLVGLGINFMDYFKRGKAKSKNENNNLFVQNQELKKQNKELRQELLDSDNCYDIPAPCPPCVNDMQGDCVVCLVNRADHVLLPCGHVCVCKRCARIIETCPICRQTISERKHVYFAKEVNKNQFLIKL